MRSLRPGLLLALLPVLLPVVARGQEAAARGDAWELYDLAADRSETRDLAAEHPARVAEMAAAWTAREEAFVELVGRDD